MSVEDHSLESPQGESLQLESLQQWMLNSLIHPRQTAKDNVEQLIQPSSRLTSTERLLIYQRSYYQRLIKCFADQFPALCHALGQELFDDFAFQYLQDMPSVSYTLYDLGRRFPDYLANTRPDRDTNEKETWVEFMIDLAHFERKVFVMFDALGWEGKSLAQESVPNTQLKLQPCFQLHRAQFAVAAYYHAVKRQENPTLPPREPAFYGLVRKNYFTHTIVLSKTQHQFLGLMLEGRTAAEALRITAEKVNRPLDELTQAWMARDGVRRQWINAGFFIDAASNASEISGASENFWR